MPHLHKAAAAEMQRRLFETPGWLVRCWTTTPCARRFAKIGDSGQALPRARTLFARALETPGGLKIQTIHAFCEKLLRRFPLEAGVSPGFAVLEGAEASEVQAIARERLAELALESAEVGDAYAHMAVELAPGDFEALFTAFGVRAAGAVRLPARGRRLARGRVAPLRLPLRRAADPTSQRRGAEAAAPAAGERWARGGARAADHHGSKQDGELARKLLALVACSEHAPGGFGRCLAVFSTADGGKLQRLGTKALDPAQLDWLLEEQARLHDACGRRRARAWRWIRCTP